LYNITKVKNKKFRNVFRRKICFGTNKKMKKKTIILPIIAGMFLFAGFQVFAQEDDGPENVLNSEATEMLSGSVTVTDLKVVSQQGSEIKIGFDIRSGYPGQAGIMFSADLVKEEQLEGRKIERPVDIYLFQDKLYLEGNKKEHKELVFKLPGFYSGNLALFLMVRSEKGYPFDRQKVGDIQLSGSGEYIGIDPASCYLAVQDELSGKKYNLGEGVDVSKDEILNAVCDVKNNFKNSETLTPVFTTFYRSTFGEKIAENKLSAVSLGAGESKTVTFAIPKAQKPQSYDAVLSFLGNKGEIVSNKAVFHYVLRGLSASILNLRSDKNSYEKGEMAKIALSFSGSADDFPWSRAGGGTKADKETINVEMSDLYGKSCGRKISETVNPNLENNKMFSLVVTEDCVTPEIKVDIRDSSGNILDQASFVMGNGKKQITNVSPEIKNDNNVVADMLKVIILLVVLVGLIVVAYLLIKKNNGGRYIRIFVFFVLASGLVFGLVSNSYAAKPKNYNKLKKLNVYREKLPSVEERLARQYPPLLAACADTCPSTGSWNYSIDWNMCSVNSPGFCPFRMRTELPNGNNYYPRTYILAHGAFLNYNNGCWNAAPGGQFYMDVTINGKTQTLVDFYGDPSDGYTRDNTVSIQGENKLTVDDSNPFYATFFAYMKTFYGGEFVGTVKIPYVMLCNPFPGSVLAQAPASVAQGDAYELNCNYGKQINPSQVFAFNSAGSPASSGGCSYKKSISGNQVAVFGCSVAGNAPVGSKQLTSTCTVNPKKNPDWFCEKSNIYKSDVTCVRSCDPPEDEVCQGTPVYADSCGNFTCNGNKFCPSGNTCPKGSGCANPEEHCGPYPDGCGNPEGCEGKKPESECPAGWKEIKP
jgi:hypothetical protein